MEQASQTHLDWYESGRLSSYVSAKHSYGDTMSMLEARQPAGDMSDPLCSDIVFVMLMSTAVKHQSDFGAGKFSETASYGMIYVVPPNVATTIEVYDPHVIRTYAIAGKKAAELLADHIPGSRTSILAGFTRRRAESVPRLADGASLERGDDGNPEGRLLPRGRRK